MITRADDDKKLWREQCRRQMQRPLWAREHYGFVSVPRPVFDEAPFRVFDSMAEYRQWCDEKLPRYLGYNWRATDVADGFRVAIASDLGRAFAEHGVDYLFIGKGGAIVLGYPGTTLDVDVFAPRTPDNGARIVAALKSLGFEVLSALEAAIVAGRDFVQITDGPFNVDIVFAPDGIESFEKAKQRRIVHEGINVASLDDIIASKRAAAREKDRNELPMLENFRDEYLRSNPRPLRSAQEINRDESK